VFRISTRSGGKCEFQFGFCHAVVIAGGFAIFAKSFRQYANPIMSFQWAEPTDFGTLPFEEISLDVVTEFEWMRHPSRCARTDGLVTQEVTTDPK